MNQRKHHNNYSSPVDEAGKLHSTKDFKIVLLIISFCMMIAVLCFGSFQEPQTEPKTPKQDGPLSRLTKGQITSSSSLDSLPTGSSSSSSIENESNNNNNEEDEKIWFKMTNGETIEVPSTTFTPKKFPCSVQQTDYPEPNHKGLFYIKPQKCASTTMATVNLRMAHAYPRRNKDSVSQNISVCNECSRHIAANVRRYQKRDKAESFLWSVMRDPTKRFISYFNFFALARFKVEPSTYDMYFARWLGRADHFFLKYYSYEPVQRMVPENYQQIVTDIIDDFDFIGTTERLDESLVALQLLLDLDPSYIVYLSSKRTGSYDLSKGQCNKITSVPLSPNMTATIEAEKWKKGSEADRLLYQAVNKSLDRTIDNLGRDRFNKAMQVYKTMMALVQERCLKDGMFPCLDDGTVNPNGTEVCYRNDMGCGHQCIDDLEPELLALS